MTGRVYQSAPSADGSQLAHQAFNALPRRFLCMQTPRRNQGRTLLSRWQLVVLLLVGIYSSIRAAPVANAAASLAQVPIWLACKKSQSHCVNNGDIYEKTSRFVD